MSGLTRQGDLHLAITQASKHLAMRRRSSAATGVLVTGNIRFTVSAPVNTIDPNAVLGMFTWSYDSRLHNYREIDIELSRW